jgi:polyvinyl alcohol dehydrogenase (cytochrome)
MGLPRPLRSTLGGGIGGPGVTIAGGMVFANLGYALLTGTPGNVLLAFGVE